MHDIETLTIHGLQIDKRLLEVQPVRRCDLAACRGLCCSHGVWVDVEQKADILRHADLVKPHLPAWRQDEQVWFCDCDEADGDFPSGRCDATNTFPDLGHPRGGACIFLRPDARCALQVAAVANGLHRWTLKPFFCALYPLVICQGWLELDGESEPYQAKACRGQLVDGEQPLYMAIKDEFVLALGKEGYRQLCRLAAAGRARSCPQGDRPVVRRILVVDDDESAATILRGGLAKRSNCEVVVATDGEQSLRLFEQQPFDLLITDYAMPGMDGVTLAEQVQQSYPHTAIVMVTAGNRDEMCRHAMCSSIQRILEKPVKLAEIRATAMEALGLNDLSCPLSANLCLDIALHNALGEG